jgi:histidinol dehydrogenase
MMPFRTLDLATARAEDVQSLVERSAVPDAELRRAASSIVDSVRSGGDAALLAASTRFGGSRADGATRVPASEIAQARAAADPALVAALQTAIAHIRTAHEPQRPVDAPLEVVPGVRVDRRWQPCSRVGVYVPGGQASYPSSLLMGVIPAQIASVSDIAIATPADGGGTVSPALLTAAAILGVHEIHAMGGAQAIAALAYGTETVTRVDKIVGPGNAWVTAAKLAVFGDCAVDLPAGPSEALVIADHTADARIVAADLLCQAEHGPDSPVVLVTTSPALADAMPTEVDAHLEHLERVEILAKSLADHARIVLAPDIDAAVGFANRYAPEHLSIHTADARAVAERCTAAGSVFVGHWSPESAGDYATGANHVLPTGGLARSHGPLSVEDFGSWRQVQELTRDGLEVLLPTITELAGAEGLSAHALAATIRFRAAPAREAGR